MSDYTTDGGIRIHFREHGEGDRVVMLVHGWMMSGAVWDDLLAAVQPGIRYVIPDLRGTGGSDAPSDGYTLERLAADVVGLADHLGLERFAVVGHSMGGQVAQQVALQAGARVDGLLLLNSVPPAGMKLPDDAHGLFFNSAGNREMQGTILDIACTQLPAETKERLLDGAGSISQACIQGTYEAWTGGGFADQVGEITAKTLVVATSDPFLPPEFLQAAIVDLIPKARMTVLAGPGHYPQAENPGHTAAVVEGFLAGLG